MDVIAKLPLRGFLPSPAALLPAPAEAFPVELALLGGGERWLIAREAREIPFAEAVRAPLARWAAGGGAFTGQGTVLLVSYDQHVPDAPVRAPSRAFRVDRSLVVDWRRGQAWLAGGLAAQGERALWRQRLAAAAEMPTEAAAPWPLLAAASDEHYESLVRAALADIRAGRYYQINLLRYFTLQTRPTRTDLLARLAARGGPFAAWLRTSDGLELASFSPERFISLAPSDPAKVAPEGGHDVRLLRAETFPVKGTASRLADPVADAAAAAALAASPKDRAELAMIVDLMRNDLGRVARPGSVAVPEPLRVDSHANVHHLSARITAELPGNLDLAGLLAAVCPGGSITGAPKREVMGAIRAYEERERGYFMGTLWYLDDGGAIDSSILIRTLARHGDEPYAFAAGSGIVIASDPEQERLEIAAKCRVLAVP